jgi:murein DD-endopeptidase MepM/ murein hydrolase activator NlpD
MRRITLLLFLALPLAAVAVWWVKFEHAPPTVEFRTAPELVGRRAAWDVVARAPGAPGLRHVEVRLLCGGTAYQLLDEAIPAASWIGSGVAERTLHVEADFVTAGLKEGPAQLQVIVETHAWRISGVPRYVTERPVTLDLTAPLVELLSTQHNVRLGGAAVAVFRVAPDAVRAGVAVERYFFPATRGYFADPAVVVAVFAVPQDLTPAARVQIEASDAVGNATTVALPCRIRDRRFPERPLQIDDQFLQRKVPELLGVNGLAAHADLVQGYLFINGDFRRQTEQRLRELTATSAPAPLWDGAFRRQSNAAPMSAFADRRLYLYRGETIDRQTHLGYDLASLEGAPVEAAQNGVVVFAGNLGIYGNTVILDHGLGVFSLYGHLRAIAVQPGQHVRTGQGLGNTGETGLAGGDHLHFSIMLYGIHVDPVEWWDPKWLRDHVGAKLAMLPAARSAPAPGNGDGRESGPAPAGG